MTKSEKDLWATNLFQTSYYSDFRRDEFQKLSLEDKLKCMASTIYKIKSCVERINK